MDVAKFKRKFEESGLTVEELSDLIGIDPSTYYRKVNSNGENFTVKQAKKLAEILGLSPAEASEIFLS
jgi:transcriptional regulator with XRE-family HTH domain